SSSTIRARGPGDKAWAIHPPLRQCPSSRNAPSRVLIPAAMRIVKVLLLAMRQASRVSVRVDVGENGSGTANLVRQLAATTQFRSAGPSIPIQTLVAFQRSSGSTGEPVTARGSTVTNNWVVAGLSLSRLGVGFGRRVFCLGLSEPGAAASSCFTDSILKGYVM